MITRDSSPEHTKPGGRCQNQLLVLDCERKSIIGVNFYLADQICIILTQSGLDHNFHLAFGDQS